MVTTVAALKREQHRLHDQQGHDKRRDYWRRRRIDVNGRLVTPIPDNDVHGELKGYLDYCCRCDLCSNAMRQYNRRRSGTKTSVDQSEPPATTPNQVAVRQSTPSVPAARAATKPAAPKKKQTTKRKTSQQPAVVDPAELLGEPLVPLSPGAQAHIECFAHLEAVQNAYYRPQTVATLPDGNHKRHHYNGTMIVVAGDGTILRVSSHDQSNDDPESLVERHRPKRRTSGGGGNRTPTSMDEVIRNCRQQGCEVRDTGGKHLKVIAPNGDVHSLPRTPSDWRSIANTVSEMRASGVDLRRQ